MLPKKTLILFSTDSSLFTLSRGYLCYSYRPRNDTLRLRSVDCSEDNPCDSCQGNCLSDLDCGTGLTCFIRPDLTPVPGCEGRGINRRNYCYEPPRTEEPIPSLTATECNRTNPCELCEGECNRHSDVSGMMTSSKPTWTTCSHAVIIYTVRRRSTMFR